MSFKSTVLQAQFFFNMYFFFTLFIIQEVREYDKIFRANFQYLL